MKKTLKTASRLTLGDLVLAVTSVARNSNEAAAAMSLIDRAARRLVESPVLVG